MIISNLYIDNYKGFEKQLFDFNRINFLVGENSTGKSSVLEILRVIYDLNDINFQSTAWKNINFDSLKTKKSKTNDITIAYKINKQDNLYHSNNDDSEENLVYDLDLFNFILIEGRDGFPFLKQIVHQITKKTFVSILHKEDSFSYLKIESDSVIETMKEFVEFSNNIIFDDTQTIERVYRARHVFPFEAIDKLELKPHNYIKLLHKSDYRFVGPIRNVPDVYDFEVNQDYSPDGSDLFSRILRVEKEGNFVKQRLNSYGLRSNLFEKIEPYTITEKIPIPINTLTITKNSIDLPLKFNGTGLSQILPFIFDLNSSNHDLLVSQPEVHLHPLAQFELGKDIFKSLIMNPYRQIFIETHSDYLIDSVKEDLFIMDFTRKYFNKLKYKKKLNPDNLQDKDIDEIRALVSKETPKIKDSLLEDYPFENYKELDLTIKTILTSLFFQDFDYSKTFTTLTFFTFQNKKTPKKKVFPIIINSDGSTQSKNSDKYREFFLDYTIRGLML